MSGGGDDGGDRDVKPGPWWRSVGFWLGLWVLVFLLWVWVDSYSRVPQLSFPVTMDGPGWRLTGAGVEVAVQRGRVVVGQQHVPNPPAGMTTRTLRPRVRYEAAGQGVTGDAWWGTRQFTWHMDDAGANFNGVRREMQWWWFPFAVVVGVYVGAWLLGMWLWRRWMTRRGKREMGAKGFDGMGRGIA